MPEKDSSSLPGPQPAPVKQNPNWASYSTTRQIALVQPAIRLIVLEVWAYHTENEETDNVPGMYFPESTVYFDEVPQGVTVRYRIYPVVAIQTSVTQTYHKRCREGESPPVFGNSRDMEKNGWRLSDDSDYNTTALIVHGEYGLIPFDDSLVNDSIPRMELIACPWPNPSADFDYIAPRLAYLAEQAWRYFLIDKQ